MNTISINDQPINLTKVELFGVTTKKRNKSQLKALLQMGIPCLIRPDGSPLVSRMAFEQTLGVASPSSNAGQKYKPNFGSLKHAKET